MKLPVGKIFIICNFFENLFRIAFFYPFILHFTNVHQAQNEKENTLAFIKNKPLILEECYYRNGLYYITTLHVQYSI